jgi:hypothetical protein
VRRCDVDLGPNTLYLLEIGARGVLKISDLLADLERLADDLPAGCLDPDSREPPRAKEFLQTNKKSLDTMR